MARPMNSDYMQGFRYHAVAIPQTGTVDPLQPIVNADSAVHGLQAGFQSITVPELSVEASEYREGIFTWTEKYPGVPTVSDITLMRGVVLNDTAFYDMCMKSVKGLQYRYEVQIWQYVRGEMTDEKANKGAPSMRKIICNNCFATRAKPSGDLDSTAGDVSMAEVDICMESFEITTGIAA
jgi:phage tail-like protein